jgi:hypothetical protein
MTAAKQARVRRWGLEGMDPLPLKVDGDVRRVGFIASLPVPELPIGSRSPVTFRQMGYQDQEEGDTHCQDRRAQAVGNSLICHRLAEPEWRARDTLHTSSEEGDHTANRKHQ